MQTQTSITIPGLSSGSVTINDKSAIVLDIGMKYTKVGMANEQLPRAIIPSEVYDAKTRETCVLYDCDRSRQENMRIVKQFLLDMYNKQVGCNAKSQPVCIVESVMTPSDLRSIVADTLFDMEVPSILLANTHNMVCMPFRANTAIVVDCGYREVLGIPVVNGVLDLHHWQSSPMSGMRGVLDRLRLLLVRYGTIIPHDETTETKMTLKHVLNNEHVSDIYTRLCFVTSMDRGRTWQDYDHAMTESLTDSNATRPALPDLAPIVADVTYTLNDEFSVVIPHYVREMAAEVLFITQHGNDACLTEVILNIVSKAAIDDRRTLAGNIILAGGGAHVLGLHKRLFEEIKAVKAELYPHIVFDDDIFKFLRFSGKAPMYNCLAWTGGSICASTSKAAARSITAKQYEDMGRVLPDWCNQEDTPFTPFAQNNDKLLDSVSHEIANELTPGQMHTVRRRESNAARANQFTTESLLARANSRMSQRSIN